MQITRFCLLNILVADCLELEVDLEFHIHTQAVFGRRHQHRHHVLMISRGFRQMKILNRFHHWVVITQPLVNARDLQGNHTTEIKLQTDVRYTIQGVAELSLVNILKVIIVICAKIIDTIFRKNTTL